MQHNTSLATSRDAEGALRDVVFDAREAEAYYVALHTVGERREVHDLLKARLQAFLTYAAETNTSERMQALLLGASAADSRDWRRAIRKWPADLAHGAQLMELPKALTFERLRIAYRRAAAKHHPDRGGAAADMVAINLAHARLHESLAVQGMTSGMLDERTALRLRSVSDYRCLFLRRLLLIGIDEWDLDAAKAYTEPYISAMEATPVLARSARVWSELGEPLQRHIDRLVLAGRAQEARGVLRILRHCNAEARKRRVRIDYCVKNAQLAVSGQRKPLISFSSLVQLDNARKYGIVAQERYDALRERIETARVVAQRAQDSRHEAVRNWVPMQDLPTDRQYRGSVSAQSLVPPPAYFSTRIAELTDDQHAEYFRAFASRPVLALAKKYFFVRLVSILESALIVAALKFDEIDVELTALESIATGSGGRYVAVVRALMIKLGGMRRDQRELVSSRFAALLLPGHQKDVAQVELPPLCEDYCSVVEEVMTEAIHSGSGAAPPIS